MPINQAMLLPVEFYRGGDLKNDYEKFTFNTATHTVHLSRSHVTYVRSANSVTTMKLWLHDFTYTIMTSRLMQITFLLVSSYGDDACQYQMKSS